MSRHEEFESTPRPQPAEASTVREAYPASAAAVDEFKALFGSGVTVLALQEGGKVVQTKNYKAESEYSVVLDGEDFLRMGRLSAENKLFANKGKRHE